MAADTSPPPDSLDVRHAIPAARVAPRSRPPNELTERARQLLDGDEDRHDDAIVLLRRAVAAGDEDAVPLLTRAYVDRNQLHEVVELLAPRVHHGRHHREVGSALSLAEAWAGIGDDEHAEDAYRIAVRDGDPSALNSFGVYLRNEGRHREAERVLRRAALAGSDQATVNLVAVLWDGLRDPRSAIRAAEHWSDESRPVTLLGLAFARTSDARYDEAERLYRRAAELGAEGAHLQYATFLQDVRGDLDGAERELTAAEEAQETDWALAFGQFLFGVGRYGEARAYLRHAAYWGSTEATELLEELDGDPYDE